MILFFSSFIIYSYNLEGQPWHGDEITYLGWGGNYVHMIANRMTSNQCLVSLDSCTSLFHIPAFGLTYSPLRNMIIGLPMYLSHQDTGNFYNWSCYWDCYKKTEGPTIQQMTAGRLLSPLFGSLGLVLSFLIGKELVNRRVGLIFAFFLMFYNLWIWYSRTIMVEIHYVFFLLLSTLFLLCAFKTERPRIHYVIISALLFGVSLEFKMLSASFAGLFFFIVLFRSFSRKDQDWDMRKKITSSAVLICLFFSVSLLGLIMSEPGFYLNPAAEIQTLRSDMNHYNHDVWYIGYPSIDNIQAKSAQSLVLFSIFPSFLNQVFNGSSSMLAGNLGWTYPPTYSSVPMTLFFFLGLGCLITKVVKSRMWYSPESLILAWLSSTFVILLTIVKDFSLERYLLPVEVPMILAAAYGLWLFANRLGNPRIAISFVSYSLAVHSATSLSYWQKIYFSPGTIWVNPLHYGTLQQSLDNQATFTANLIFLGFTCLVGAAILKKSLSSRKHTCDAAHNPP